MMPEFFTNGGVLMWPLLVCSLVAVTVIVERALFWLRATAHRADAHVCEIFDLAEAGRFEEAVNIGQESRSIPVRVLTAGLAHRNYGLAQSMEAAAVSEIEHMKRGLSILDTIITLAPLLGILGTVSGIIKSFNLLSLAGIEDPKGVSGGIAEALITTAAGLTIAITALIPYNALTRKVEKVTKYLERLTTHFELTYQKGLEKRRETE